MLSPHEILDHCREDIRRTLRSQGTPECEIEELVQRSLAHWVACSLSSAMICASLTESYYLRDRPDAIRQLWNWE